MHPTDLAGSTLGDYHLIELLGRGGMGEVYRARDTRRERDVALKLLNRSFATEPTARERFMRESRTVAGLNNPHVIPIHDWGEIDGQLFLDMRLVPGADLRARLVADGPMDVERALAVIDQIGSALDAAHAAGIVHRDVKPDNVMIDESGFVYLADFGLAASASETRMTQTGHAIGSFAYMAPERFGVDPVGPAADVYSLTCVLYECIAGTSPYGPSTSIEQVVAGHLTGTPTPLGGPLDAVIARGLATDPARRHPTAAALVADARRASQGSQAAPTVISAPRRPVATTFDQPTGRVLPPASPATRPNRLNALLVVAAVVLAAVVAGGAWYIIGSGSSDTPAPAAAPAALSTVTTTATEAAAPDIDRSGGRIVWHTSLGSAELNVWLSDGGHNWATLSSSDGRSAALKIWSDASGWQQAQSFSSAPPEFSTPTVYAPGRTCIRIDAMYGAARLNRKIC